MNYPEGSAGAFIGVLITILGSVALGGAALLVLQQSEEDPLADPLGSAVVTTATPGPGTETATPAVRTSTTATATPTSTPTSTPTPSPTPTEPPVEEIEYVVVPGDALDLIAARHGVPSAVIVERNGLVPPYTLEVGQVLFIPME